ncbi:MAG TPA: AAA family ATPase [Pseudolabrys sp.]|nr:AAA family ATPase [Pseudolabrys sp.]
MCPLWPEIHAIDGERRQRRDVAARSYRAMTDVYAELGYELIAVPRVSVEERVRFVREAIGD